MDIVPCRVLAIDVMTAPHYCHSIDTFRTGKTNRNAAVGKDVADYVDEIGGLEFGDR